MARRTKRSKAEMRQTGRSQGRKRSGISVADVMTPQPVSLVETDTVAEAAHRMADEDVGAVVVLDGTNASPIGILTDRDIVVRGVAEGLDLERTTLSTLCSAELVTIGPADDVDTAVDLMRERAIRRLIVLEDSRAVGIVSLGDLALERDPDSALAEISEAPPNV